MFTGTIDVILRAEWCHSLKERRMVARSIVGKLKSHFNIAILEEEAEEMQIIKIVVACLAHSYSDLIKTMEQVIHFIEDKTDAELIDIKKNIL